MNKCVLNQRACTKTSWSTSLCMLVSCLALWVKPRGTRGRPIFVLMILSTRILMALKKHVWLSADACTTVLLSLNFNTVAYCITLCFRCVLFSLLSLSCSFHLCSMKWNRTEFLYHPQLLQVQIINKETEDKPSKSQATTLKTHRRNKKKRITSRFFVFISKKEKNKLQEVTKSWNDQRRHQPNRNTEEKQSSAQAYILRSQELIWNQKFVPTQQLWQSTRPNAAPSPHPHHTTDSPPGCGVGCYMLVIFFSFSLVSPPVSDLLLLLLLKLFSL